MTFRATGRFLLLLITTTYPGIPLQADEEQMIISFEEEHSVENWFSVNDGVMGGVSRGGFIRTKHGTLLFSGHLSLANNGGFASIRNSQPSANLEESTGLLVTVRGDGRSYWLDLREDRQRMASSYRAPLPTSGQGFEEIFVPFSSFQLTSFGRPVRGKALDPSRVRSVGFTLSDKKEGPFQLEIKSIRSVSGKQDTSP